MNHKYFVHHGCSFFPCHNLKDWKSCLFCWCPLYLLDCDGNFVIHNGIKDCSNCVMPHTEEGYDRIVETVSRTIFPQRKQIAADQTQKLLEKNNLQPVGDADFVVSSVERKIG